MREISNRRINLHILIKRKRVIKIEPTNKTTSVQLVEEAVALKKSGKVLDSDSFWAVYDRESTAKYSNELHEKARIKAQNNGINIALTNVCFEYWLLLHLTDTSSPYNSYTDLINNSDFKEKYKNVSGMEYEKGSKKSYDALKKNVDTAKQRAKNLNIKAKKSADPKKEHDYYLNPYCGIPYLLDAIDKFK